MKEKNQIGQILIKIESLLFICLFVYAPIFSQSVEIKNGVNIQASYYNNGSVNMAWDLMKQYPEIEALRIEIEPYRAQQARSWIREAHENGYQVIATYHDSNKLGSDDPDELMNAANWWKKNYNSLSESGPIIINLMNEWGSHDISPTDYAHTYNDAIAIVREFYNDPIIVDVPGWGQATKIAADSYASIIDRNIIFSIHVYTSAFNIDQNRWLAHDDLSYLDATGAACMVGEFCDTSTGGADWCTIIDNCFANEWPLFGWAWNGDGRTMNMIEPHWRDEPLADKYRPTEFMQVITDKLKGIPCYTQPDDDCDLFLLGERCDDGNEFTINDRYNENCHCTGIFTEQFISNTSGIDLIIYPNMVSEGQETTVEAFNASFKGQLNIFDGLGKLMSTQKVFSNQDVVHINTTGYHQGVYYVSYVSEGKIQKTKQFFVF